jgi:hypothetical protein
MAVEVSSDAIAAAKLAMMVFRIFLIHKPVDVAGR